MGTFTISYFLRKCFIERPKWHYPFFFGACYIGYRYVIFKRHHHLASMKGHTRMYKSRREEILRWDPHADIWKY
uniref:Uncharacterized protein n=1 Tax=Meloidogyne incognita TaxID=6306 RepID=A0A914M002_MELIC